MDLHSASWRKLRRVILARDSHTCQWCGAAATQVDHLIERDRGGSHDPENLVASCASCNASRGAKYGNAKRSGQGRRAGW